MRFNSSRLLIPVAVAVGLSVPGLSAATAAGPPSPQKITGVVQTIIREHPEYRPAVSDSPSGDPAAAPGATGPDAAGAVATGTPADDTTRVLQTTAGYVPLTDGSLPRTRDGATVAVTVVPGADGAKQVVSARQISAPAAVVSPVTQHVYVALVVPAGVPAQRSLTTTAARAMVSTVSRYWSSQTGGQVSFDTAQVLAYQSAYGCGASDTEVYANTYKMWHEAHLKMPAADGAGKHLVLVAPSAAYDQNCFYGLGTIGAVQFDHNEVFVSGLNQSLLAHELGHNLGLYHSNSLRCNGVQDRPVVTYAFPGCQASEYDDLFDVMGYSGADFGEGSLNAVHLDGMNLLPDAVRKIPAGSGVTTAVIAPLSTTGPGRTLKITDPGGASYFVEYRTNSGRDAFAAFNFFRPAWGVRVLRDNPAAPPSAGSYELDDTPTGQDLDYNRSIRVGDTFTATSRKVTIRLDRQDASGATLTVASWASQIVPFTASLSLRTSAWVGAAIIATTKVSDRHGSAVASWVVTLQKKQQGTSTWRSVRSVRTGSAGTASYRFANGVSGSYRWVTSPAAGAPGRASPPMTLTSKANVVERRPAGSVAHRTYLSVIGSVSRVPAPVVYIQYRYGAGPWRTGPRASVSGTTVSGRIAMNVRTTASTRLVLKGTAAYLGSTSGYYATTVR